MKRPTFLAFATSTTAWVPATLAWVWASSPAESKLTLPATWNRASTPSGIAPARKSRSPMSPTTRVAGNCRR